MLKMYNKETHLSDNFSKEEVTRSETATKLKIDNTPSEDQWKRIQLLVDNILQPARNYFKSTIQVNSIFRSKKLNEKVSTSTGSQHLANNGAAGDIELPNKTNKELFDYILDELDFDQLIWEFGDTKNPDWVHVSYVSKENNRHNVLKALKDNNGKVKYVNYKKS